MGRVRPSCQEAEKGRWLLMGKWGGFCGRRVSSSAGWPSNECQSALTGAITLPGLTWIIWRNSSIVQFLQFILDQHPGTRDKLQQDFRSSLRYCAQLLHPNCNVFNFILPNTFCVWKWMMAAMLFEIYKCCNIAQNLFKANLSLRHWQPWSPLLPTCKSDSSEPGRPLGFQGSPCHKNYCFMALTHSIHFEKGPIFVILAV